MAATDPTKTKAAATNGKRRKSGTENIRARDGTPAAIACSSPGAIEMFDTRNLSQISTI